MYQIVYLRIKLGDFKILNEFDLKEFEFDLKEFELKYSNSQVVDWYRFEGLLFFINHTMRLS